MEENKSLEDHLGIDNYPELRKAFYVKLLNFLKSKVKDGKVSLTEISLADIIKITCECSAEHVGSKPPIKITEYELTLSYILYNIGNTYIEKFGTNLQP